MNSQRCPECKNRILQKSDYGYRLRVDGCIAFDDLGSAVGKCFWCKADIQLPIKLDDLQHKSAVVEHFILQKRK